MRSLFLAAILALPSLVLAGGLKAEGPVPQFTLESELRLIPQPMSPKPLTYAGMKDKEITITVDDGPDPVTTPEILKVFRDHGVKANFFLVGRRVKAHPELVRMILKEGHSVSSHTWDHPDMSKLSLEEARKQLVDTQKVLEDAALGTGFTIDPFMRFPFGAGANKASLQNLLQELNLANFYWSMSAHDSRTKNPSVALATSIEMIDKYKKGLFLMHETHPAGLKMLPYFLAELHRRGYKTVYFKAAPK